MLGLGPIFERELRATSRRKRTYVLRVAYLGGLLLFLLLGYTTTRNVYGAGGVAQRVQQQNQLGQVFFAVFAFFGVIAMAAIGPVLTSTAIGSERLHKTLAVMLMTPINSFQIVIGKLFSRLLVALTLVGLSLPVLALVRLLGGVDLSQMFGVLALCAITAVSTAAVGLFFSTLFNRSFVVILISYGLLLFIYGFIPFAASAMARPNGVGFMRVLMIANPIFNVSTLATPSGMMRFGVSWWEGGAVHLTLAAVLTIASALLIRRMQRREGEASPGATTFPGSSDNAERLRARRRDVWDNPVLWREVRRPLFPRRWQSIAAASVLVGGLLASYSIFAAHDVLGDEEAQIGYAVIFNGLAWLAIAVISATAIAQENEGDTWTLLVASPLSARAIVIGKALGLCRRMLWPMLLIAAHFTLFALGGVISWVAWLWVIWIIVTFNTVWIATGVYLSLRVRRVTFAVILNMLIAVVLYVGVPIVLQVLGEVAYAGSRWSAWSAWGIPYMYLVYGVDSFSPEFTPDRQLWLPAMGGAGSTSLLLVAGLIAGVVHVIISCGLIAHTIRRFNRIVGRAPQQERIRMHLVSVAPAAG